MKNVNLPQIKWVPSLERTIVTHGGPAHRDDFLSCACLMAFDKNVTKIRRGEPTPSELNDPNVYVVDVGGKIDHNLKIYDHHQIPPGEDYTCALKILNETFHWGLENLDWLDTLAKIDHQGPFSFAKEKGWDKFPFDLIGPLENSILEWFEKFSFIESDWLEIIQTVGTTILRSAAEFKSAVDFVESSLWVSAADTPIGMIKRSEVVDMPMFTKALSIVRDKRAIKFPLCIFPTKDRESSKFEGSWTAYRFDDDPRVSLDKLEGLEGVKFAHKGGFIAVSENNVVFDEFYNLVIENGV